MPRRLLRFIRATHRRLDPARPQHVHEFFSRQRFEPGNKDWYPDRIVYKRMSDLRKLGPCNTWLFCDEHPDSINNGCLFDPPDTSTFTDMPASFHNNACGIAFADGHSEIHKWLDGATCPPIRYITWTSVGNTTDLTPEKRDWLKS